MMMAAPGQARVDVEFLQNLVTFFQPRGEAHSVSADESGASTVLVWNRGERSSRVAGGIALSAAGDELTVQVLAADGYDPPSRMLRLDLMGATSSVPLSGRTACHPGDHFLIPVDRNAETILLRLTETLRFLPADVERSFFHLIARPSLELRVRRLEELVEGREARPLVQSPRSRKYPYKAVGAGLAVVCLVVILVSVLHRTPEPTPPQRPTEVNTLVSARNPGSQRISAIYQAASLGLLTDSPSSAEWKRFAIEVLKLEMVTHNLVNDKSEAELSQPNAWIDTLSLYESGQGQFRAADRKLISWASCKAFGNPDLSPALAPRAKDCPSDSDSDLGPTLLALTTAVSNYQDPPQALPFSAEALKLAGAMQDSIVVGVATLYTSHRLADLNKDHPFSKNLADAIVKLELLRLKLLDGSSADLTGVDKFADSVAILNDPAQADAMKQGESILLGFLLCQATGAAEFHGASIPGVNGCSKPEPRQLQEAFDTLTKFAQGQ